MALHNLGDHSHGATEFGRAFAVGIALNLALVLGQLAFGFVAGSLALIAECGLAYVHVFPYSARPGTPAAEDRYTVDILPTG